MYYCALHSSFRPNLDVLTFSKFPMVGKIEALLVGVYSYYKHNLQKTWWKLAKMMETKGFKILWNIQTWWISMVIPSRVVLKKFKIFLVKMAWDFVANEFAFVNYELFCDVESVMGLTCAILMLEFVQILSKYVQNRKMFIRDFVKRVKLCQANLHKKYCDEEKNTIAEISLSFKTSSTITMILCTQCGGTIHL